MSGELHRRLVDSGDLTPVGMVRGLRQQAPTASGRALLAAASELRNDLTGAGRIEALLREPGVSDVCINGPGVVWIDRGSGLEPSGVVIDDNVELRGLAARFAALGGQRLDDANPYVDSRLPDGVRVHVVLPPISPAGVHISLRVPPRAGMSLDQLVSSGSLPIEGASLLHNIVAARLAFLVIGGTGTGKTTILGALLSLIPAGERIVIVEDAAELHPQHPHVVRLEARRANAEGSGEIGLDVLIRQALRMRPDRLVVGEARGGEIADLLTALNTGHAGGCGTLHADRVEQVPARVEAMAAMRGWTRQAAHSQLAAAVDVVIALCRRVDGRRLVAAVGLVQTLPSGEVVVRSAYSFDPEADDPAQQLRRGPVAEQLDELLGRVADVR